MTEAQPLLPSLTARIEERILSPLRRNRLATRTRFVALVAATLFLHAALLAVLLYRDSTEPRAVEAKEQSIEVVVEPPTPPPAKAPEKPKPESHPEIEKPASSAPRPPNEQKIDTAALDKETHAPKTLAPPADGAPTAPKEAASPSDQPAKPEEVADAAKADDPSKNAEALDVAAPTPPPRPAELAKPAPRARVRRMKTALEQLSGTSPLPDYSFARPTKKSPVYGGSEDSRYLAIVYGMILAHRPRMGVRGDEGSVTIDFNVDDDGTLVAAVVERSSGDAQVDAAGMAAVRRAAPFPPLPAGAPHGLVATIDFSREGPVLTTDSRGR